MIRRMVMLVAFWGPSACGVSTPTTGTRAGALEAEADRAGADGADPNEVPGGRVGEVEVVWVESDPPIPENPDDQDLDGYTTEEDTDDTDPFRYPGARDVPCDGIDQDDDGLDLCFPDLDRDGYPADVDCDDGDPGIQPFVIDSECDGIDENCNGFDECDSDGDGALDHVDPDPRDPAVRPAAPPEAREEGAPL